MLHLETVEPETLSLLKKLMSLPELNDFCLAVGTALSLKLGHRISVDLDLFSSKKFEVKTLTSVLNKFFNTNFSNEQVHADFAIFCRIQNVKVDIIYYLHETISDVEVVDGIRMYSDKDIATMKINAILGRGVKKDFWDLYELLKIYSLNHIINWHKEKFPSQMLLISIPNAITYFEDADQSPDPISLKGQTWKEVKVFLQSKVREYLK